MIKLSIIVPIYNVERYLNRCVDSILDQTFTDFEVILVDDGSPDRCPTICDEFLEKEVFASAECVTAEPDRETAEGFSRFLETYVKGLDCEKKAVECIYTLDKPLFKIRKFLVVNNSRNRVKRKKLFFKFAVFVYAELYAVSCQKFIYCFCIFDKSIHI